MRRLKKPLWLQRKEWKVLKEKRAKQLPGLENRRSSLKPLVVMGLGNPGSIYAHTRHNAGYWVVEVLRERLSSQCLKKPFFSLLPYRALFLRGKGSVRPLVLLRYDGYMNQSGRRLPAVLKRYGVQLDDLLVVVDNMDLPPGECRLRRGGGTAGHNGLKSVSAALGGGGYSRLYIGVGRPVLGVPVVDHVLGTPDDEDSAKLEQVCRRAAEGIENLLQFPFSRVAEELNRREH